jgi:hypothetical protein
MRQFPKFHGAAAALGLTAVALAVAACSPGSSGPQVAHLPGHHARHAGAPALTMRQSDEDMIAFARCVRAHGVPMRDPFHLPGHSGLSIGMPADTAANRPALDACRHFLAPIIAMKQAGTAGGVAADLPALTRYAQCMRAHDIPMLNPTSFGALNLGNVPGVTGDYGRYTPQFRAADAACRHLLPSGVHDNGTGP